MNLRNIIKPYPSPIITGRGIDLDFPMLAGCPVSYTHLTLPTKA